MAKNLTEEELKSIQDINQRFMNTKVAIADAVVSQTKMIDALDTIQQEFRDLGNRNFLRLPKDEHLVRLHIGLEDPKDLIQDLKRSLKFIK